MKPALAAPNCGPVNQMIAGLKANYGEVPLWEGILEEDGRTIPVIMFASVRTKTWTLVSNPSPQVLCMLMKGSGFDISGLKPVRPLL